VCLILVLRMNVRSSGMGLYVAVPPALIFRVMHWFLSIDGAGGGSVECALRTQEQSSSSGEMTWMWVA
jgi:hypothetical protein